MAKTDLIQMRISPEIKAMAEAKAGKLGLSLSEYIRWLIMADTASDR